MDTQNQTQDNKYCVNKGVMDKSFFNEYIREYVKNSCSNNMLKKCDKILEDFEFIEYFSIGIESDRIACYSELWFLDINESSINNKLLPVFIKDINTSSYYSLARCSMDYEDSDDEDDYKTLDEILSWCPSSTVDVINKILHNKI